MTETNLSETIPSYRDGETADEWIRRTLCEAIDEGIDVDVPTLTGHIRMWLPVTLTKEALYDGLHNLVKNALVQMAGDTQEANQFAIRKALVEHFGEIPELDES